MLFTAISDQPLHQNVTAWQSKKQRHLEKKQSHERVATYGFYAGENDDTEAVHLSIKITGEIWVTCLVAICHKQCSHHMTLLRLTQQQKLHHIADMPQFLATSLTEFCYGIDQHRNCNAHALLKNCCIRTYIGCWHDV